jgi:hypothetical protein
MELNSWREILDYVHKLAVPFNQRDDVHRAYLRLGPMQPKLNKYKTIGKQG